MLRSKPPPPTLYSKLLDDLALLKPTLEHARRTTNGYLQRYEPWQILLIGAGLFYLITLITRKFRSARQTVADKGLTQILSQIVLDFPYIKSFVAAKQSEAIGKLRLSLKSSQGAEPAETLIVLPREGISAAQIKARLVRKAANDVRFTQEGESHVSGTVYITGSSHQVLLNEVYKQFSLSNPMHADIFRSVVRLEAEVVAMTSSFLGGGPGGDPSVCGSMTSGGTESILTAVKASRDYMAATKGISEPEMVVAESAHAAFVKAAEYFKIRLIKVPVGPDYRLSGKAVSGAISKNTILVVASAPGFPHGVVDHIRDISKVCKRKGVLLHVDACLGGFVLPFARHLGKNVPLFDFSIDGVTSMSIDTHKFGQSHKGTSVVLYRNTAIRRYQYTRVTDWTGGLYISPGFAGSRNGALIATAWAALLHMGRDGYISAAKHVLDAAEEFTKGLSEKIPDLEVIGSAEASVVAFKSRTPKLVNIYKVNDLMTARGWHLNALQRPAALHMCFTAAHGSSVVAELVRDLEECVAGVKEHSSGEKKGEDEEGTAPMYGMAATVPDRRIVGEFLASYQDILLEA